MTKDTVWVVSLLRDAKPRWDYILRGIGCEPQYVDSLALSLVQFDREQIEATVVETRAQSDDELELCRRLRERFDNPILLVAIGSDEEYCVRAYEAGVDECVADAVTDELLSAKLNAWLRWSSRVDSGAEARFGALEFLEAQ